MTKKAIGRIILVIILLVAFNVFTFTIPVLRTKGFWVAYAFGNFAILYQLYTAGRFCGRNGAEERVPGFPAARLGVYYLVIQMAVSVTQIVLSRITAGRTAMLINCLILAFPIIGFITTRTLREEMARQEKKRRGEA